MVNKQLNAQVLGQLMLMQSIVINLPVKKSIFSFVCKGLMDLPGVNTVIYIENRGEHQQSSDNLKVYPIIIGESFYGMLEITLQNKDAFEIYHHYIENFVFMLGVILEERKQRELLNQHQQLLEQRIDERTKELLIEIENRKKAEEALILKNKEYITLNEEYLSINEELYQSLESLQFTNDQLEKAKVKAEESNNLKTAFLQNLSHEIRTPMNAIMGFSELLVSCYNDRPKLEKYSEIINQRCRDLLDVINDILNIAKIESGQLPLNYTKGNLGSLYNDLFHFFNEYRIRINKQNIEFLFNAEKNCLKYDFVTDWGKVKQILINLFTNAFKYTQAGKVEGKCKIENNMVVFSIADTGIGIPKEKQDLIFERFVQLDNKGINNIGGTGLGLPIVKGLIKLLNGNIEITSEENKGSIFTVSIPVKVPELVKI